MGNRLEDWKMKNGYKAYPLTHSLFCSVVSLSFFRDSLSFRVPPFLFLASRFRKTP